VYANLANIVFAISCRKRRDLLLWLLGTTAFAIGAVFIYLQAYDAIYLTIGNLVYLLSILFLMLFIFKEYNHTFLKKGEDNNSHKNTPKYAIISLSTFSIALLTIQIIMMIASILAVFMLLRIYLKKRTITRLFMFFTILAGLLTLILRMLYYAQIEEGWELSYVTNISMITFL